MRIPAAEWNKLRAHVVRHAHAIPGAACSVTRAATGTILRGEPNAFRWRHPWFVSPSWDGKQWTATVRPGFVNGVSPTIDGTPLCATPPPVLHLPVTEVSSAPPPFFAALGVRDPMEGIRFSSSQVQIVDESWRDAFRPPPRRLARCDISLSIARPALGGAVGLQDAASTGQSLNWTPSIDSTILDSRGTRPIIQASKNFEPPRQPTALDRLMGTAIDPQEDAVLLSTVFLLSPPQYDGPVDGSWAPYVQHACFWNLAHASRHAEAPDPKPITLATGLVGGMFDGLFNQLLAPGNEHADRIHAAFASQSHEGKFWTI